MKILRKANTTKKYEVDAGVEVEVILLNNSVELAFTSGNTGGKTDYIVSIERDDAPAVIATLVSLLKSERTIAGYTSDQLWDELRSRTSN